MSGSEAKSEGWPRWVWLLALLALLGLGYLGLRAALAPPDGAAGPIRGLRLGYTTAMARARFEPGGPGRFRSEAMGEDLALVWIPDDPDGPVRAARMEFHLGLLVAVRLTLRPDQPGAEATTLTSEASVLARETVSEGVRLTWIARSCPTHAEEVERLISQRR